MVEVSERGLQLLLATLCPAPARPRAGPRTFEAVPTQALKLILASRKACGAVLAGLALARRAVVALPNAPTAQEAVGEV